MLARLLIGDMDIEVAGILGHAHVLLVALNSHIFAVLRGTNRVENRAQVDVVKMGMVDADLPALEIFMVDRGKNLSRQSQSAH